MAEPTDLDLLRSRLGFKGNDKDQILAQAVDTAVAYVEGRVYIDPPGYWRTQPDCVEAVMLLSSRLYARQRSPEGVAGWGDLGVIRVLSQDPDIDRLLERHVDCLRVGLA